MSKTRRIFKIAVTLTPIAIKILRDRKKYIFFGGPRELTKEEEEERAEELVDKLMELGPAFIKIGQLLSTRPDLIPKKYIEKLSELQDKVPPAPYEEAKKMIEKEIGPVEENFEEFKKRPIAGASLGQVYKAKLNGSTVAVKVNRPNVEELIETDISIFKGFIPLLKKLAGPARAYSMKNIVEEFSKVIEQEMDYKREADYMDRIKENLEDIPYAKIPGVKWTHTTKDILTMDYIKGTKIKYPEKIKEKEVDTEEVAKRINQIYLTMVIRDGVFQADPHPGNIGVTDDGKIVIYDFGMAGEIGPETKQKVTKLYLALARKDPRGLIRALVDLGTLKPGVRINILERIAEKGLRELEERKEWRAEEFLESIQSILYDYPFKIPAHLALLIRMSIIIEGECRNLQENFNFVDSAKEYIKHQGIEREQLERKVKEDLVNLEKSLDVATKTPQKIDNLLDQIRRNEIEINTQIEDPDQIIGRLASRLFLGLLASASLIFTGLVLNIEPVLAGSGIVLTFLFTLGFLLTFKERKRKPWEPRKPLF